MSEENVVLLPEYEHFVNPSIQKTVEKTTVTVHRPISSLDSSQIVEFLVSFGPDEYMLPYETFLQIRIKSKVTTKDKSAITNSNWYEFSACSYLHGSLFKQLDIIIGDKQITQSNQAFPYYNYLKCLFEYNETAQKTWLKAAGFVKPFDFLKDKDDISSGSSMFSASKDNLEDGKEVELFGKLHFDLAFQEKTIPAGCCIRFKMLLNDPSFYLIKKNDNLDVSLMITDCNLFVTRAKVAPEIVSAHRHALQLSPAKIPFVRFEPKATTIAKGLRDAVLDNLFIGDLPRKIYIMLLSNDAFNGNYHKNPFNFKHYNLNYISCYVNGEQCPSIPYQPDFENGIVGREYLGMYIANNDDISFPKMNLTIDDFKNGSTIYIFNFAQDLSSGVVSSNYKNMPKRGALRCEMRWAEPLPETITVLVASEFDSTIYINSDGKAFTDYN